MASSAERRVRLARDALTSRLGAMVRLLMQVRLLLAAISVLFLSVEELRIETLSLLAFVALFSWLAARYWDVLVPWALAYPVLAWADVAVSFAVLGISGQDGPFFLFTLVNAAVAGLLYRWPGMVVMCLFEIGCYYLILWGDRVWRCAAWWKSRRRRRRRGGRPR